ncbi:MAG: glycosyltransferase [Flavobacteriales bacterium]|nr:glycosyltransferase [Flavobacteriales bacterium]
MTAMLPAILISIAYGLFAVVWLYGWRKAIHRKIRFTPNPQIGISLLIPFRDEEKRIQILLDALLIITAEFPNVECIFVNDHSTDGTQLCIQQAGMPENRFKILSLPESKLGKKEALTLGVQASMHPIIITTDADSRLSIDALAEAAAILQNSDTYLVCGPVLQHSGMGLAGRLADIEFLSLMTSGIAFWGAGMPFLCNGAFLAFKKETFIQLNGYQGNLQFPGGDDVFLLEKCKQQFGKKAIHFLTDAKHLTHTQGDTGIRDFISRRIRWGSKAKAYGTEGKSITLFLFLLNMAISVSIVYFMCTARLEALGLVMGTKLLADGIMLGTGALHFHKKVWIPFIPLASMLHSFYITFSGLLSLVLGRFHWKKRKF